jgi:hypothetical protein
MSEGYIPRLFKVTIVLGTVVLKHCLCRKKNWTFPTFPMSEVFSLNFYVSRLSRGRNEAQKTSGLKNLRSFFHDTTKTSREVFGSLSGESLSLLLVKVAMTPPFPSQQAITCTTMPSVAAEQW